MLLGTERHLNIEIFRLLYIGDKKGWEKVIRKLSLHVQIKASVSFFENRRGHDYVRIQSTEENMYQSIETGIYLYDGLTVRKEDDWKDPSHLC